MYMLVWLQPQVAGRAHCGPVACTPLPTTHTHTHSLTHTRAQVAGRAHCGPVARPAGLHGVEGVRCRFVRTFLHTFTYIFTHIYIGLHGVEGVGCRFVHAHCRAYLQGGLVVSFLCVPECSHTWLKLKIEHTAGCSYPLCQYFICIFLESVFPVERWKALIAL